MAIDDGVVRSARVPYVSISVTPAQSAQEVEFEALVDTGYPGFVVVPVGSFGRNARRTYQLRLRLADGSSIVAPAYSGRVRIGRASFASVPLTEIGDTAIIGMQMIGNFTLVIDHGATLSLAP